MLSQMGELEGKLRDELRPDSKVVVCRFPIPNRMPVETFGEGIDSVWLYNLQDEIVPGYIPPGAPTSGEGSGVPVKAPNPPEEQL
jgi:hypothetical protein